MSTRKKSTRKSTKKTAKKTTRKTTKKTTRNTKNTASQKKKQRKRVLICAKDKECFWSSDGKILANLVDLKDALEHMADETFKQHANKEKNDFADWIGQVLKDRELATAIRKSRKPSTARKVVIQRLKVYDV